MFGGDLVRHIVFVSTGTSIFGRIPYETLPNKNAATLVWNLIHVVSVSPTPKVTSALLIGFFGHGERQFDGAKKSSSAQASGCANRSLRVPNQRPKVKQL